MRPLLLLALLAAPAVAQPLYLQQTDLPTAQARSQQQCVAVKCDGVFTRYWWPVQALTSGAAIIVQSSGPYASQVTVNGKSGGLTAPEVSALQTAAQIAPLLPVVVAPADAQAGAQVTK